MAVCAPDTQEAVGGVANPRWQNLVPEHGVDHSAFPIARPGLNTRGHKQPAGLAPCRVQLRAPESRSLPRPWRPGGTDRMGMVRKPPQPEPVLFSSLQSSL